VPFVFNAIQINIATLYVAIILAISRREERRGRQNCSRTHWEDGGRLPYLMEQGHEIRWVINVPVTSAANVFLCAEQDAMSVTLFSQWKSEVLPGHVTDLSNFVCVLCSESVSYILLLTYC
jgi:hypothetical protein